LSIVFIRYFPSLGRFYGSHGGDGQLCGVTTQKNALGVLVVICGLPSGTGSSTPTKSSIKEVGAVLVAQRCRWASLALFVIVSILVASLWELDSFGHALPVLKTGRCAGPLALAVCGLLPGRLDVWRPGELLGGIGRMHITGARTSGELLA
jgi:hypothetical protein